MMTMLGILGITGLILTAVFAFGVLDTPYYGSLSDRLLFLLVVCILAVLVALGHHPFEGYDPMPTEP